MTEAEAVQAVRDAEFEYTAAMVKRDKARRDLEELQAMPMTYRSDHDFASLNAARQQIREHEGVMRDAIRRAQEVEAAFLEQVRTDAPDDATGTGLHHTGQP